MRFPQCSEYGILRIITVVLSDLIKNLFTSCYMVSRGGRGGISQEVGQLPQTGGVAGFKRVKSLGFYRVCLFQNNAHDAIGYVASKLTASGLQWKTTLILHKTTGVFILSY